MVRQPVRPWKCLLSLDLERTYQGRLIWAPCSFSPFPSLTCWHSNFGSMRPSARSIPRHGQPQSMIMPSHVCVQLLSAGKRRGHAGRVRTQARPTPDQKLNESLGWHTTCTHNKSAPKSFEFHSYEKTDDETTQNFPDKCSKC